MSLFNFGPKEENPGANPSANTDVTPSLNPIPDPSNADNDTSSGAGQEFNAQPAGQAPAQHDSRRLSSGSPSEIPLLKDMPQEKPELGYQTYIETLAAVVRGGEKAVDNTPLTIGLFAPWGSGKSTLLKGLEEDIRNDPKHGSIVVNFNAWHRENSPNLAVDLLTAMGNAIVKEAEAIPSAPEHEPYSAAAEAPKQQPVLHKISNALIGMAHVVAANTRISASLPFTDAVKLDMSIADLLDKTHRPATEIPVSESTVSTSRKVIERSKQSEATIAQQLDGIASDLERINKRIVVMIDDLDRCTPEGIVQAIETISSLTGRKGMIFILAMDHDYVIRALENHYAAQGSSINGDKYLEKIVQIPFWIPLPKFEDDDSLERLVGQDQWGKIEGEWLDHELKDDVQFIVQNALRSNPRQTKRFVNSYLLLASMYWHGLHNDDGTANDVCRPFLYFLGLQIAWPVFYMRLLQEANKLDSNQSGESGSFFNLDIVKALFQADASGQAKNANGDVDWKSVLNNINQRYNTSLTNIDDLLSLRAYMNDKDDRKVFSTISAENAKAIMKMAATGMNTTPERGDAPDMSKRDMSKWYWKDEKTKLSKWDVLHVIIHEYRNEPENKDLSRDEFEHKLGELLVPIVRKQTSDFKFDEAKILSPAKESKRPQQDDRFTFAGDETEYWIDWWCGFTIRSVGTYVHRPVIEYFRDVKGYPIRLAK